MAASRADKGKQRAMDQDEHENTSTGVMDLDEEELDEEREEVQEVETTPARRADDDNLGSSVSRSARMRATATPDERENGDDSEDGSSSSHTSDEDNEDDEKRVVDTNHNLKKRKATSSNGPFVTASNGEAYLRATSRPAKTSNKKLSEAFTSNAFTHSTYLQALEEDSKSERSLALEAKLLQLETAYEQLHSQWDFELQEGFSLFFYGMGSKIRVLNNFVERYLQKKQRKNKRSKGKAVVINGFMAALGIDDILSALESIVQPSDKAANDEDNAAIRNAGKSAAKLDERAKDVVEALNSSSSHYHSNRPIYLLIYNIDGPSLRSFRAQAILSLLVSQPAIRLIASIDHIRAPLLFPSSLANARPSSLPSSSSGGIADSTETKRGYQILYHHIPTHRPYTLEALHSGMMAALFPPSIFISEGLLANGTNGTGPATSEARAKAAFFVLASLPQKAKDLFVLLAERQISLSEPSTTSRKKSSALLDSEKTPDCATLYSTLFSLARDRFLANNVNQFEALLREFRDHSVILSNRSAPEGIAQDAEDEDAEDVGNKKGEWVWVGIENEDLEALVEKIGS